MNNVERRILEAMRLMLEAMASDVKETKISRLQRASTLINTAAGHIKNQEGK
jgi:hypothetical protein